jgi:hypothetical protein
VLQIKKSQFLKSECKGTKKSKVENKKSRLHVRVICSIHVESNEPKDFEFDLIVLFPPFVY